MKTCPVCGGTIYNYTCLEDYRQCDTCDFGYDVNMSPQEIAAIADKVRAEVEKA